jgi:hypothetical protein
MVIGVGEGGERERVTVTPESKMAGVSKQTTIMMLPLTDARLIAQLLGSSDCENAILNMIASNSGKIKRFLR